MISVTFVLFALLLALVKGPSSAAALEIAYCSSQNTGASFKPNVNTFQSNGLCRNTCNADYAFAILQGKSCWCSNYAPGETTNISECSDGCPGYPADNCGSVSKNLYAYIEMTDHAPSGTAKASNTATKTESSTSSIVPEILTVTVTAPAKEPSTTFFPAPTSTSTSATSSSTSSTITTAPTKPTVSVQTVAGQPVTITVQNPPATATSTDPSNSGGSSLSAGAIAGIVIGSLVGLGILMGLLFWFLLVRRRYGTTDSQGNLLDSRRQSKASQMSLMRNLYDHNSPARAHSPIDHPVPAFTDSRMKKDAVLDADTRSIISLQDNQDYSRPILRLMNPD